MSAAGEPPSCCKAWIERYLKLKGTRDQFKVLLKEVSDKFDKLQAEHADLKKAHGEEQVRAEMEARGKDKELAARVFLESQISALKSQICLLQQNRNLDAGDRTGEQELLQDCGTKEEEINLLKGLLEEEKRRAEHEKKGKEKELAARVSLEHEVSALKLEISSLKKKETADAKVRQGEFNILQGHVSDGAKEISHLRDLLEKEKILAETEKEGKEKELAVRISLENEISSLKCEISKLKQAGNADAKNKKKEMKLLQDRITERGKEINHLKELLESEKGIADSARKRAETEKNSAAQAWELVKEEKAMADEERKNATMEQKKAKEYWLQLEALKKEAEDTKLQLLSQTLKLEDANRQLEACKDELTKERERVYLEMAKAEEQRKLAAINWKKVVEEKSRADDQLSCLLVKDNRRRIEELQKQIRENFFCGNVTQASVISLANNVTSETTKLKLLEKQLKLEKMRRKHAKEAAKLEKGRNSILQLELGRLRQDLVQILSRVDVMGKEIKKDVEFASIPGSKLKRKHHKVEPHLMYPGNQSDNLLTPGCTMMAASGPARQDPPCTTQLLHLSGGSCTESSSGINSKLESLLEGSNQKLLESSAINSSSASFSDDQLVGSQERGDFITTSENLVEENVTTQPTISSMSGEVTRKQHNENLAVVAESTVCNTHNMDIGGMFRGHGRKRTILDAVESVQLLHLQKEKLHMQFEERLSSLRGVLNTQIDELSVEPEHVELFQHADSYTNGKRLHKKRRLSYGENVSLQKLSDTDGSDNLNEIVNEVPIETHAGKISSPANKLMCIPQDENSFGSDFGTMASFDEVTNGDYMKLLELNNSSDEESYRRALEMPVSPTLPEIECLGSEMFNIEKTKTLEDDCSSRGFSSEQEILVPSHDELLAGKFAKGSAVEDLVVNKPGSANEGLEVSFECHNKLPSYSVTFSNMKDSETISRVFLATGKCMAHCLLDTQTDSVIHKILHALQVELWQSSREKACTFFTLLLLNFPSCTLGQTLSFLGEDLLQCMNSFSGQINEAVLSVQTRSSFLEVCCLDDLLELIEDFLIDGRMFMLTDGPSEISGESGSIISVAVDGININLCLKSPSPNHLVVASIVLASVCSAVDQIEHICELSYKLLWKYKCDTALLLDILHIFAYLAGEKFFSLEGYSLTMTVLKAIVLFLELGPSSNVSVSSLSSANEVGVEFHRCSTCPFLKDVVSIDDVALRVMGNLQTHAKSMDEIQSVVDVNSAGHKCLMLATQSNPEINGSLSDLCDLLSLLEVLARYMSWGWTCGNIISVLLELLERRSIENFAVAVVVLLGQLGRIGVAACGYDDEGVENLRHNLCGFLWRDATIRAPLPVQLAAVRALQDLLPLDFEEVIHGDLKDPARASHSNFANSIRDWFFLLSKEQQALSFNLLRSTGVAAN